MISAFVVARTAVAPPGGCTVFVVAMMAEDTAQATAPATHWRSSQFELRWNNLWMMTPVKAEKVCPRMAFLGCASGVRMEL